MRKGGLKGLKGVEGSDFKLSKGKKGLMGKGFKRLGSIPECDADDGVPLEGVGGEDCAGSVGGADDGNEVAILEESSVRLVAADSSLVDKVFDVLPEEAGGDNEILMSSPENSEISESDKGAPFLSMIDSVVAVAEIDSALDLCEAQPLQNMAFLLTNGNSEVEKTQGNGKGGNMEVKVSEVNLHTQPTSVMLSNGNFPPLTKENFRNGNNMKVPPSFGKKEKDKQGREGGQPEVVKRVSPSSSMPHGNRGPVLQQNNMAGASKSKDGIVYR